MSTSIERTGSAPSAVEAASNAHRRVGLAIFLGGFGLLVGGTALPWVTDTCTAHCALGAAPVPYVPLTAGPVPLSPWVFLLAILLPYSLLVVLALVAVAVKVALQERLPADRRSAIPALVMAGLLLVGTLYPLLSFAQDLHSPVMASALGPGGFVSLLGCLLIGLGGWLRYHPRRIETPRELADAPAER